MSELGQSSRQKKKSSGKSKICFLHVWPKKSQKRKNTESTGIVLIRI